MENTHIKTLKGELKLEYESKFEELDSEIRDYIDKCRYEHKEMNLKKKLESIIDIKYTSKNIRERRRTIRNIENYYMLNYLQLDNQELLFSCLSIFSTVLIMVYAIFDLFYFWGADYFVCAGVFFVALLTWLVLDKMLRKRPYRKLKLILEAINSVGNSWIFLLNLVFYLDYAVCYHSLIVRNDSLKYWHFSPVVVIIWGLVLYILGCRYEYKRHMRCTV